MSRMRLGLLLTALVASHLSSCGSESPSTASVPPPPPPPPLAQAGGTGSANPSPSPSAMPSGGIVCSQVYVYGIMVRVIGPTGDPIPNAQVTIRDGAYTETLGQIEVPSPTGIYQGAGERPGTYQLKVSAPGYVPQIFENLVVSGGVCHVTPVTREVSLLPY